MEKNEIFVFTEKLKNRAIEIGFADIGITRANQLHGLPRGPINDIAFLQSPEEEMPEVQSVILLSHYAWDHAFNVVIDSTYVTDRTHLTPKIPMERYQLYYELLKHKAWLIVDALHTQGFKSRISLSIPLKPAATQCGLGYQGKNTLLITPQYGPRVRLIAVLTDASLTIDTPFTQNLCQDCECCVQACPTHALTPYALTLNRCLTYAVELPAATNVPQEVRQQERQLITRPTAHSYLECAICIDACPFGQPHKQRSTQST